MPADLFAKRMERFLICDITKLNAQSCSTLNWLLDQLLVGIGLKGLRLKNTDGSDERIFRQVSTPKACLFLRRRFTV